MINRRVPSHRSAARPAFAAHAAWILGLSAAATLPPHAAHADLGRFSEIECECMSGKLMATRGYHIAAYDEATGRDLLNYAPHRHVDLHHMRLELDIPDMNRPTMDAVETLTFSPIAGPIETLGLDALDFSFGEITGVQGAEVESTSYDGNRLQIRFAEPIEPDQTVGVRLEYTLTDPADGLFWTPEQDGWPGRAPQIHTQGQPETNRHWFATHDSPNERLTTEIIITVPEDFTASANGRLVSEEVRNGRRTAHWLQDKDHPAYLVSLIVGQFDVVDVGTEELPMPVYVPPGRAGDVQGTYGMTADMVRVFEDRFGEPYPWDRYAQLVVYNFGAGGMENTAATTMYDTAIYSAKDLIDDDLEGLIAHELGHQWFGDLITCESWAHIWLNEGWATYSTALWEEADEGWDEGYLARMLANMDRVARLDTLEDEASTRRPAMVSRRYEHPWEVFRRRSNPYPKGASILHMLRMKLGDETFFNATAEYVDRFKFDTVETSDLREVFEDVSGLSLDRFFNQWVHRPGIPAVTVTGSYDLSTRQLHLVVEQTQRVDEFVPAFAFKLPIHVATADGETHEISIDANAVRHERTIDLDREPAMVVVDPELHVLKHLTLEMPERWLANQLAHGPTVPARIIAARALAGAGDAATDHLVEALFDPETPRTVRQAAAAALSDHEAPGALLSIAADKREDARVRQAAIRALDAADADARSVLQEHRRLAIDRSAPWGVQTAAITALGNHGEPRDLELLAMALDVESRDDEVRRAAIRAIAALDEPAGLELILPFVEVGTNSRTRPVAMTAVAALAHHDRATAYDAVSPHVEDQREARARRAALSALVEIEDERGVELMRRVARSFNHPVHRDDAGRAADRLAAALASDQTESQLRERLESLETRLRELDARSQK